MVLKMVVEGAKRRFLAAGKTLGDSGASSNGGHN